MTASLINRHHALFIDENDSYVKRGYIQRQIIADSYGSYPSISEGKTSCDTDLIDIIITSILSISYFLWYHQAATLLLFFFSSARTRGRNSGSETEGREKSSI